MLPLAGLVLEGQRGAGIHPVKPGSDKPTGWSRSGPSPGRDRGALEVCGVTGEGEGTCCAFKEAPRSGPVRASAMPQPRQRALCGSGAAARATREA